MVKNLSLWRKFLICLLSVLMLSTLTFGLIALNSNTAVAATGDAADFQRYLQYTRAKDEDGNIITDSKAGWVITGFSYIAGSDKVTFNAVIPAFHQEGDDDELPVIGIAQGVFAGYPLKTVTFEQIERNAENKAKFELLHNFVLSDTVIANGKEYAPSFTVTGADYGTAMLSIGGYYTNGRKIASEELDSDDATVLQSLGAGVFEGCQDITTVTFPGTVKEMGPGIFKQSGIVSVKSTTPIGGLTYSGDVYSSGKKITEFYSMQGLVYLKKLPYRAFYRSTKFTDLILPDYAGAAEYDTRASGGVKITRADNKETAEEYFTHAYSDKDGEGIAYFVPMYDANGDGTFDRMEEGNDMLTLHTIVGLSEIGDEAFFYSSGLLNKNIASANNTPDSDKAKIKQGRLYLAGVTKMGVQTFANVGDNNSLLMDMGRKIAPGTVEGYPGAYKTEKIAWFEGAPYYATFTVGSTSRYNFNSTYFNKEATYVFNAQTQEICGVWQNRKGNAYNQTAGTTILIPHQIKTFTQVNDESGTASSSLLSDANKGTYVKGIADGAFCGTTEVKTLIFDEWDAAEASHGGRIFGADIDDPNGATINRIGPNTFRGSSLIYIYNMPESIEEIAKDSFEQAHINVITTDSTTTVNSSGNIYVHNYYFSNVSNSPVDYAPVGTYNVVTGTTGTTTASAGNRSTIGDADTNVLVTKFDNLGYGASCQITSATATHANIANTVIFPLSLRKIGYRAFRGSSSYHTFQTVIFPGYAEAMDIDAAAFTEIASIKDVYFGGWSEQGRINMSALVGKDSTTADNIISEAPYAGRVTQNSGTWSSTNGRWNWILSGEHKSVNPSSIKNWPWSANSSKMHYIDISRTTASTLVWNDLVTTQGTDTTGIWTVFYNHSSGKKEGNIVGVNMATLLSKAQSGDTQAKEWLYDIGSSEVSTSYYIQGDNTPPGNQHTHNMRHASLRIPSQLTVQWDGMDTQETITIRTLGAPSGDVKLLGGSLNSNCSTCSGDVTKYVFDTLTIPKEVQNITTATFQNVQIRTLIFETDDYNRDEGMQNIGLSAFRDCNIEHLQLPEYSLKVLGDRAFEANNLNPHHAGLDTASDGHIDNDFLVIPGNVESVSPTAFKNASKGIQKIYVMQYSETDSDGYYDLMSGKYNNYNLRAAGSMGINYNGKNFDGTPVPVYFIDQFRPEFYEIGKVGDDWQALVAIAGSKDNNGAYDLPYVYKDEDTPLFVHPILDDRGEFTGEVAIRFGVRMLLQSDIGTIYDVTEANGTGAKLKKTAQKYNDPNDKKTYGTDFYIVELDGITSNTTYTFRVQYRNDVLMEALKASGFHYYTAALFATEFNIPVNVFSTVQYNHAVASTDDDRNLLPDDQTANIIQEGNTEKRIAFYSGYAYGYQQENDVYRRVSPEAVNSTTKSVSSEIRLSNMKEGTLSNSAYAEFIGWTTDITIARTLQLDIPTDESFYLPETQTYPLGTLLGDNNAANTARLYSVFRYVVNNHTKDIEDGVDKALGWVYGEDPLNSGYIYTSGTTKGDRIPGRKDNVASGWMTLVKIEGENITIVGTAYFDVGGFDGALSTLLNTKLPYGTYQLYGGDLSGATETYRLYGGDISGATLTTDYLATKSAITAKFNVEKLEITVSSATVSEKYGDHKISDATAYVAEKVTISPTEAYKARVSVVPDDHNNIIELSTTYSGTTYPDVGTYNYSHTLLAAAEDNYDLTPDDNVKITYTVTQRPIDITNAGIITDNSDVIQSNSRTYTWEYDGENFKDNQFKSFELSNHMSGDNQSAYKYVWYKEDYAGQYVKLDEGASIKDAGNYRVYIQWTDYNYIIDSVNRTVFGAASAEGNRIEVKNDDNDNPIYNVIVCDVVITRATLTIDVTGNTFTYDGKQHGSEITFKVTAKTDAESFTLTGDQLANISTTYRFTDAGTHTVIYSLINSKLNKDYLLNYNPVYNATYEVVINAADITVGVNATSSTKEYDGEAFEYDFTGLSNLPDGNTVKYQYYINGAWTEVGATGVTDPVNVGDYIVRVYIVRASDGGTNYNIVAATGDDKGAAHGTYYEYSFKITAYDLSASGRVTANNKTVNFQAKDLQAEAEGFKVVGVGGAALTFANGEATDSKNNKVTLQFSTNGYTWSNTIPVYRNVGTYTIQFIISAPNYADYTGTYTFTINAIAFAQFTDSLTDISATYNATAYGHTSLTFMGIKDGDNEADTAFTSGLTLVYEYSTDSGDNKTWLTSQTLPTFVNAGTYYVRYTVSHVNYYYVKDDVTYNSSNPYTYTYTITIAQKELKFTPNTAVYYYNGGLQGNTTFKVEGLAGSDNNTSYVLEFWTVGTDGKASTHTTSMPTYRDAGEYTVYYTVADGGNYTCAADCSYKITIKPAEFTVALTTDATAGLLYRGTEFNRAEIIIVSATDNGGVIPVFGTDYTVSYKRENSASQNVLNAGSYTVTISVVSQNFLIYYTVNGDGKDVATTGSAQTLSFIVKQAEVGVEAYTPSFTYNGSAQYSGARFTGTINGLPPTVSTVNFGDNTKLYVYVDTNGVVTTSANSQEAGKTLIYTLSLVENGGYTNVGTYTINVAFAENGNFKFADGALNGYTYQITAAVLQVVSASVTYNGKTQVPVLTFTTVSGTVVLANTDYTVSYKANNTRGMNGSGSGWIDGTSVPTNADTYIVTVTLKNGNYVFQNHTTDDQKTTNVEYVINPYDISNNGNIERITVTLSSSSYGYTGSQITPTITSIARVDDNGALNSATDYTAAYLNNVNAAKADSTLPPTIVLQGQGNYTGTREIKFTITPASLGTITVTENTSDGKTTGTFKEGINSTLFAASSVSASYVYSGAIRTIPAALTYTPQNGDATQTLTENVDFNVSYYAQRNGIWVKLEKAAIKDTGNYRIYLQALTGSNYTGGFLIEFKIIPAHILLVFEGQEEYKPQTLTYDGRTQQLGVSFVSSDNSGVLPNHTDYTIKYGYSGYFGNTLEASNNFRNAGTYSVTATFSIGVNGYMNFIWETCDMADCSCKQQGDDGLNCLCLDRTITYTIEQAKISAELIRASADYTGSVHDLQNNISWIAAINGGITPGNVINSVNGSSLDQYKVTSNDILINVGTYIVKVTLYGGSGEKEGGNFYFVDADGETTYSIELTYTITPATVGATAESTDFVYNGTTQQSNVRFTGSGAIPTAVALSSATWDGNTTYTVKSGDTVIYTLTFGGYISANNYFADNGNYSNVGTYTVTVTFTSGGNFSFGKGADGKYNYTATYTYVITPALVSLEGLVSSKTYIYNGQNQMPANGDIVLKPDGNVTNPSYDYIITPPSGKYANVGQYIAQVQFGKEINGQFVSGGNFAFRRSGDTYIYVRDLTYTISAFELKEDNTDLYNESLSSLEGVADLTVWAKGTQYVYTSLAIEPINSAIVKSTTFSGGKILLTSNDYSITYINNTNAGTASVTISGYGNYTGSFTLEFTIKQMSLSGAAPDNADITYTGISDVTYSNAAFSYAALTISYAGRTLVENTHYNVYFFENKIDGDLTKKNGQIIGGISAPKDAGTYYLLVIAVMGTDNGYNGNYADYFWIKFTINRATIRVNASGITTIEYDGAEHKLGYYIEVTNSNATLVAGDYEESYSYNGVAYGFNQTEDFTYKNSGTYTLTISLTTAGAKNFEFVKDNSGNIVGNKFTYEIIPRTVSARLSSGSVYYYDGTAQNPRITFTHGGIQPTSDEYTLTYTQDSKSVTPVDAGIYVVTMTLDNKNYRFADSTAAGGYLQSATIKAADDSSDFEIKPAELSAAIDGANIVTYNAEAQAIAILFTNLTGGSLIPVNETGKDAQYKLWYKLDNGEADFTAGTPINAGKYLIKVELIGDAAKNFIIRINKQTYVELNFTVNAKDITAELAAPDITNWTGDPNSRMFDGEEHTPNTLFSIAFSNVYTNSHQWTKDTDYTVSYLFKNESVSAFRSSGIYTVRITLNNSNYSFGSQRANTLDLSYEIIARIFDKNTVVNITFGNEESYEYTGYAIEPKAVEVKVTFYTYQNNELVKLDTVILQEGDYSIGYSNNINVGTATIYIYGAADYSGTASSTFTIVPKSLGSGSYDDKNHGNDGRIAATNNSDSYTYLGSSITVIPTLIYTPVVKDDDGKDTTLNPVTLPTSAYVTTFEMFVDGNWIEKTVLNAGQYRIKIVGQDNYTGTYYLVFTVAKATISLNKTSDSVEYKAADFNLRDYISFINANGTVTPAHSDNVADSFSIAVAYSGDNTGTTGVENARNAGIYTVTVTVSDNFQWKSGSTNVFTFTVGKASVSVSLNRSSDIYMGEDYLKNGTGIYAVFTNAQNTNVLPALTTEYTLTYLKGDSDEQVSIFKNAAKFKVRVTLTAEGLNNFEIIGATNNAIELNYEITPAEINVHQTNSGSTYGDVVVFSEYISLSNASGINTVVPDMNNVVVYYGTSEGNRSAENAGVYYLSLIIKNGEDNYDSTNFIFRVTGTNTYYSVAQNSTAAAEPVLVYTITPARVSLEAFNSPTYNGEEQAVTITFINEHGDDVTAKVGYTFTYAPVSTNAKLIGGIPVNAGTYAITVKLSTNDEDGVYGNYMFGINRTGTTSTYNYELERNYIIQALQLTLDDIVSVSGEGILTNENVALANGRYFTTYDGNDKEPIPTLQVLLGNDEDITYTLQKNSDYLLSYEDNIHATYSYRRGPITNHAAYVVITGSGNYGGEIKMPFRIYQANLSFTLTARSGPFTNQVHKISVASFTNVDGGPAPKVTEISYSMTYYTLDSNNEKVYTIAPIASGTYFVEIALSDWEGNYYVLSTDSTDGRPSVSQEEYAKYASYTVGKINLIVTITDNEVYYLARSQSATITMSDADGLGNRMPVLGTDYVIEYTVNDSITDNDNASLYDRLPYNAGKYIITVTLLDTENYVIQKYIVGTTEKNVTDNSVTADFTVKQALVEAYVVGASATYDATAYYLTSRNLLYVTSVSGVNISNYDDILGNLAGYPDRFRVMYEARNGEKLQESGHPINVGSYNVTIILSSNFKWNEGDNGFVNGSKVVKVDSDSVASFVFTINPATVNVEVLNGATVTYKGVEFNASDYINIFNSNNPSLVPKLDTNAAYGATDTYTVTANRTLLNAGSYTLTVEINGGNYVIYVADGENVSKITYTFTITPSIVTVNYVDDNRIYTGEEWQLDALVFTNTLAESDDDYANVLPTSNAAQAVNRYVLTKEGDFTTVGIHTVTITLESNGNFSFETAAYQYVYEKVITYTIDPATITVNTEEGSWFYGRQGNHGDKLQSDYSVIESYHPYGDDYEGAYKLIIGAESFKFVDGKAATVSVIDIRTADGYYQVDSNNNYAMLTIGTYTLTVRVLDPDGNHNEATFNVIVKIIANAIKITLAKDAKITDVYGNVKKFDSDSVLEEFNKLITAIAGIPDFDDDDNSDATLTAKIYWLKQVGFYLTINAGDNSYSSAGYLRANPYTVGIYLLDTNNTVVFSDNTHTAAGLYVIEKLEVEVEWGNYFNGINYVYDGTDVNDRGTPAARALFNDIVIGNALQGDNVSFSHKSAGQYRNNNFFDVGAKNAGKYYVVLEAELEGYDAANYYFLGKQNTFEIVRRTVDVNLSSSSSLYGAEYNSEFSYTAIDNVLYTDTTEAALREFILKLLELRLDGGAVVGYPQVGVTYTVTTVAPTAENGLRTVDGIVVVDYGTNFTLRFMQDGTHTVNQRTVTVTANVSSVYGSGLANVEDIVWTAANLADGETKEVLNVSFKITQSSSATDTNGVWLRQAGTYSQGIFVESICNNGNYIVVFEGTYTVTPKSVTIVPDSGTSVYGETLPDLTNWKWSFKDGDGFVNWGAGINNGDTVESLKLSFAYAGFNDNSVLPSVGELIYIRGRIGEGSNPNYVVTFDNTVRMEIIQRQVTIVVGRNTAVYGTMHIGDILSFTNASDLENYGSWMYADGSYKILSEDIINLAFYLESAQRTPVRLYAPVGTYNVIGTWGYVTGNETAIRNYNIIFDYTYGGQSFEITKADIVSGTGASWIRNDVAYRQGAAGNYTDAAGWYEMTINPATYVILVGDYTIQDASDFKFVTTVEKGSESYIEFVAYSGLYDSNDKGVIIRYYRPAFTAIDVKGTEGEWYYDEANHSWRVHSIGQWDMRIEVIQNNHNTQIFNLTYVIVPVNAIVSLTPVRFESGKPLQLTYGYEYLMPQGNDGQYTAEQLEALLENELTKALNNYIMGAEIMRDSLVYNISGLEALGGQVEDWYQWLKQYCRIEVVPVSGYISSSGRLAVGTYDIRIVADESCGFNVAFDSGDYDGSNRLIINQAKLFMVWAEEYEEDGTQIVTVTDDEVTYLYTGKAYSQAPQFGGIFGTDDVSAPKFEYRLPNGRAIDDPRNVLEDNLTYTIFVFAELNGADKANYLLPDAQVMVLRIVPRTVTVTIKDDTSIYGQYTDAEIAQRLADVERYAEASWLGYGDDINSLNIGLTKVSGLNAGAYTISGTYDNLNYTVTFVNGTYTVSPKAATVTIGNIERTFGDAVADLTANYTAEGVLEGDTLKVRFEIYGATYYFLGGYLEVADNAAGYAIVGYDEDDNYAITFVGDWADGKSGIYKVNKATNDWIQLFLFDYVFEGEEPFALDLPIAKYGPTVIEYYYDEAMTERVELPVSQLLVGTYYAKAFVVETKNFTGLNTAEHVFDVVTDFIPRNRNVEIFAIVVLLAVEVVALTYALIAVRRRKNKNNNLEEGR